MSLSSQEQARIALRVLTEKQTIEQAASEHGVSVGEIESWCRLLAAGASVAATRRQRRLQVAGVVTAGLLVVGVTASLAAPCPSPSLPLPAPLNKFCPDEAASAPKLTANFAQMASWIKTKVGDMGQPVPDNWIKGTQIGDGQITSATLKPAALAQSSQIKDASLGSADLASGVIDATHFTPDVLLPMYELNANCDDRIGNFSTASTCIPKVCGYCGGGVLMASCTKGCTTPTCVPSSCLSPTQCDLPQNGPACDNTLLGYIVAP